MKTHLLRYWLAMNASAFDAAVHSCAAFFGVAGVHAAVETIPALNLKQLAAVFLITFARAILAYLDAHPLTDVAQTFLSAGSRDFPVPSSCASAALEPATGKSPEPAGSKTCATTALASTVADSPINPTIQKSNHP